MKPMNRIVTIVNICVMDAVRYVVTVSRPGFGRFTGGTYDTRRSFYDESKARDYYTDMLVRYPDYEVTIEKR